MAASSSTPNHLEVERKFVLDPDSPLPGLDGLAGTGQAREHRMRAVYLDTTDLLLIRHGITLRRREGGSDEGWHLKLPATEDARWELHEPLTVGPGRWRVPEGHVAAVGERLGELWTERPDPERGLVPAAVLTTYRLEVDLTDGDGAVVAVLCDDTVSAQPARQVWRELELELAGDGPARTGPGDVDLLDAITERFLEQGVGPAGSLPKLARALGDRPERAEQGKAPRRKGPAADVLLAYLAEQVAVIRGRELGLREDAPAAVHKTRVATRRLRSTLRTFRRLLHRDVTDPLRRELKWYADALGAPRDAEVVRQHLLEELDDVPPTELHGPVRERVSRRLEHRHAVAHAALVEVLDSERYLLLLDRLTELVADPPWRGRARRKARAVLPDRAAAAEARAEREWERARGAEGAERRRLLHETRKRAKAARYAWEALTPSFGEDAARRAGLWEQVTDMLGQVQDGEVAVGWLRELADVAGAAEEPSYTYGLLVGRQLDAQARHAEAGEDALAQALR